MTQHQVAARTIGLTLILFGAFALTTAREANADTISGRPTVTDGDTLRFQSGIRIRLFGIDTPEKPQRCEYNGSCYSCGTDATAFVRNLIKDREVSCTLTGDKTYERYVAICSVGNADIAEATIAAGWGFPYREFLKKHRKEAVYLAAEKQAIAKRLGVHRGSFISPDNWRRHKMRLECERK
jgi:endonuclease YncB( thermonuclease family)